ncbi:MAG: hypothetical protein H7Y03_14735 [Chitinophagaceae bacterium]|nr:hypothetical protein [Chitinophagaceae bacterium]
MNQSSNFLYCHDPLDEDSPEYLVHLPNPSALIKVASLDEEERLEGNEFIYKTYVYEFEDGDTEEYQLIFASFSDGSANGHTFQQEEIHPILDAAWEYWIKVLEVGDEEL